MIKITKDHEGGNINVRKIFGNEVFLEQEMRDSYGRWFYFNMCVECDEEVEVVFRFQNEEVMGYYGPAVSFDNENWEYVPEIMVDKTCFKYKFKPHQKVWFCDTLCYNYTQFKAFAKEKGLPVQKIGVTEKGRDIPVYTFGNPKGENVYLSSRAHACEHTGTFVLVGVITELLKHPDFLEKYYVNVFPFVDLDGAIEGDQGKQRIPRDHNIDCDDEPIFNFTKAIYRYSENKTIVAGCDFHSPWIYAGSHDIPLIVEQLENDPDLLKFSAILEEECKNGPIHYKAENNLRLNSEWNFYDPRYLNVYYKRLGAKIADAFETPYFGLEEKPYTGEMMKEYGACIARALKRFLK